MRQPLGSPPTERANAVRRGLTRHRVALIPEEFVSVARGEDSMARVGTGKTRLAIALGIEPPSHASASRSAAPPTSCACSSRRATSVSRRGFIADSEASTCSYRRTRVRAVRPHRR
jgi:hypothetical protein